MASKCQESAARAVLNCQRSPDAYQPGRVSDDASPDPSPQAAAGARPQPDSPRQWRGGEPRRSTPGTSNDRQHQGELVTIAVSNSPWRPLEPCGRGDRRQHSCLILPADQCWRSAETTRGCWGVVRQDRPPPSLYMSGRSASTISSISDDPPGSAICS